MKLVITNIQKVKYPSERVEKLCENEENFMYKWDIVILMLRV